MRIVAALFTGLLAWLALSLVALSLNPGLFRAASPAPPGVSSPGQAAGFLVIGILAGLDLLVILRLSSPAWRPLIQDLRPRETKLRPAGRPAARRTQRGIS
jgi:hypothetical protein